MNWIEEAIGNKSHSEAAPKAASCQFMPTTLYSETAYLGRRYNEAGMSV